MSNNTLKTINGIFSFMETLKSNLLCLNADVKQWVTDIRGPKAADMSDDERFGKSLKQRLRLLIVDLSTAFSVIDKLDCNVEDPLRMVYLMEQHRVLTAMREKLEVLLGVYAQGRKPRMRKP